MRTEFPFVCVPLRNKSKGIGVIGIDSFSKVPIAFYETSPEPNLLQFVQQIGKVLGTSIDIYRRKNGKIIFILLFFFLYFFFLKNSYFYYIYFLINIYIYFFF